MARIGMDVGVVQQHGSVLKGIGDNDIPALVSRVNNLVTDIEHNWWGPDAQQFSTDWSGANRPALTAIGHALSTYGQQAITNAQAQTETSAAGGAQAGGGGFMSDLRAVGQTVENVARTIGTEL